MKRSFNKLVLGALIAVVGALGAVNVMAQDDAEKTALYTKFTECYKAKDEAGLKACIAVGQDYMTKYGTPPDPYNDFVGKHVKTMTDILNGLPLANAYAKLDGAIKAKNWKDAFDAGRDVVRLEPKPSLKLDISLLMAEIGYDLAFSTTTPDYTYNSETINYAKSSIAMIGSGTVSESRPGLNNTTVDPTWGGGGIYALKTKDNALAWMNYTVARLTADINKDPSKSLALLKEAAPYFYKSVQYNSDIKKFPVAYQALGRYYLEELNNTVDQYEKKTCKTLPEDNAECKDLRGIRLAYADRGLDAFARAYSIVKADPKQTQTAKDNLNKTLAYFYNARYEKTDGLDDYVAKVVNQPLIDPSSPVTPIAEPVVPATTTGTTTTTPGTTTKPPATTTVKPAATATPANSTKPASTTPAKPNGAAKGTVAVKTTVKKKTGR